MAVTSIWPIVKGVRDVITYACNPEKTTEENRMQFHAVKNVLEYAADELKTEKCEYVDGINCRPDNAIQKFNETRRRFGKSGDKRVCYHGYQSFKQDEVDAKTAHEIGMELANRLWGDRFEVVVATHLDKTTHLHNHFVLNAVSFVDGKKFCNYKSDYEQMRKVSDEICRERGISVLENSPIHTLGNKNEVWVHKNGKMTRTDMLKKDIDYCITNSSEWKEFELQLNGLGYSFDWQRASVKHKTWKRARRLSSLGYTKEMIEEQFERNQENDDFYCLIWNTHMPYKAKQLPLTSLMKQLQFTVEHSNDPEKIFVSGIFCLIISLFQFAKKTADYFIQSAELRYEVRNIKQYISEYKFLQSEKLNTLKDISSFIDSTRAEITELERTRTVADNKTRRAKMPEEKQKYKDERKAITEHVTPLRKKLRMAEEIYNKSPRLFDLVKEERNFERKIEERSLSK